MAIDAGPADGVETAPAQESLTDTEVDAGAAPAVRPRRLTRGRLVVLAIVVLVVGLAGAAGWLGWQAKTLRAADQQRELFLATGRQGAINLTTIDYTHAKDDVGRILALATGPFYDDFSKRSGPFTDVVEKAQSTSVGTVTEAGVESASANEAQILVAVAVKMTVAGAPAEPRAWRMRLSVQMIGDQAKVSNVSFVP